MKKLFLLTAICGLASLSFKADDAAKTNLNHIKVKQKDCDAAALATYYGELLIGIPQNQATEDYSAALEDCIAHGGHSDQTVVIHG